MPRKWVYRIGVVLIFFAVFQAPVTYLIFGKIEKGRVIEIVFEYSGISIFPTSFYPKIEFKYQNKTYTIVGEENQELLVGDEVKVIFYNRNPSKAKVMTFAGLYLDSIIQLPIGLLIWWALFRSFPNLFDTSSEPLPFENIFPKKRVRRRESLISDAPIPTRIFIYSLIAIIASVLIYTLRIIYKEMTSGKISYQIGIGISFVILIILASIIHKVHKG